MQTTRARIFCSLAALAAAGLMAACGTATKQGTKPATDRGAATPSSVPTEILKTPDATPQVEPAREGGPNKPYALGGRSYTPQTGDKPFSEKGIASWYGKPFHGRRTASGEIYNMYAMTAAHKTMPLPSYARVRNPANGREIIVRVNDRGPFHKGRVIDLSFAAAMKLDVNNGLAAVEVERITFEDIRTGAWKRDAKPDAPPQDALPAGAEFAASGRNDSDKPAVPSAPAAEAPAAAPELAAMSDIPAATAPSRAFTAAAQGFWVQLGAFRQRGGAEQLQRQAADELSWLSPLLAVFGEAQVYRVQAGPYPTKAEAQSAATRVREALKLVPVVVERR